MNKDAERLNYFIGILKDKYPEYEYINAMVDSFEEKELLPDNYVILVGCIKNENIREVLLFVKEKILYPCVDRDEKLPGVITLQRKIKKGINLNV